MLLPILTVTTLEKLKQIPNDFWLKLGLVVVAIIAVVVFLRKVAKMNKIVLTVIVAVTFSVVGFNWVYERNEPAFLTPVVDRIAPFLPAKDSYSTKQASKPKVGP